MPLLVALFAGCTASLEPPRPTSIAPDRLFNGAPQTVTILGSNFFPSLDVPADGGPIGAREPYDVRLVARDGTGTFPLDDVVVVDLDEITATVPAGLPEARYDVEVQAPWGGLGIMRDRLGISDLEADRLGLSVLNPLLTVPIQELMTVEIFLGEPGARVVGDLDVEVTLTSEEGDGGDLMIRSTTLMNPSVTPAKTVRGQLRTDTRTDGTVQPSTVSFTTSTPQRVSVSVRAVDDRALVQSAEVGVDFRSGDLLTATIDLPGSDSEFTAKAGAPFTAKVTVRDQAGNLAGDLLFPLFLDARCGRAFEVVDGQVTSRTPALDIVQGVGSVEMAVVKATMLLVDATGSSGGNGCVGAVESLRVTNFDSSDVVATPFAVEPGDVHTLVVENPGANIKAGQQVSVTVTPQDAWGNQAIWRQRVEQITIANGEFPSGNVHCEDKGKREEAGIKADHRQSCTFTPTVAGPDMVLRVFDGGGLVGASGTFPVGRAEISRLSIDVPKTSEGGPSTWVAGDRRVIWMVAADAYGNAYDVQELFDSPQRPSVRLEVLQGDPTGPVACDPIVRAELDPAPAPERMPFRCQVTRTSLPSGTAPTLQGTLTRSDGVIVHGQTPPLEMVSGPVREVTLSAATGGPTAQMVAGRPLAAQLLATDAYGNRYDAEPVAVALSASVGPVTPASVALPGASDAVLLDLTLYKAASAVRVRTSIGSEDVSAEPGFQVDVVTGAPHEVVVDLPAAWAWVDEPFPVSVAVHDGSGNVVPTSGVVTLSSDGRLGDPVNLPITGGFGGGVFVWNAPSASDRIVATWSSDASVATVSEGVPVSERCGSAGPRLVTRVTGRLGQPDRACISPVDQRATFRAWLNDSFAATDHVLTQAVVELDDERSVGAVLADHTLGVTATGQHDVRALVQQDDLCGAETTVPVWVGRVDGGAVGEVSVSPDRHTIVLGFESEVDLTVGPLRDCRGAAAPASPVRLRTTVGSLSSPAGTPADQRLHPTGTGLELTTDAAGMAHVLLSYDGVDTAVTGDIYLSRPDGLIRGSTTVHSEGDAHPPVVVALTPRGPLTAPSDHITLTFSERMDPATFTVGSYPLSGPNVTSAKLTLLPDGLTAHWTIVDPPGAVFQPNLGRYRFTLFSSITDLAGNPLDGAYDGTAAPFSGSFDFTAPPDRARSCQVSTPTFRPDGDPGLGIEADSVRFDVRSDTAPSRWIVEVHDEAGDIVQIARLPGAPLTSFDWNGRDLRGRIVDAGTYEIVAHPESASLSRGSACSMSVDVDLWDTTP